VLGAEFWARDDNRCGSRKLRNGLAAYPTHSSNSDSSNSDSASLNSTGSEEPTLVETEGPGKLMKSAHPVK
jgi:hypothetical protein